MKKIVFVGLLGLIVLIFLQKTDLTSSDLGRHLNNGRVLFDNHDILFKNAYSYTEPDFPFINHHWLYGVIVYSVYKLSGFSGLTIFNIFLVLITFSLVFFISVQKIDDSRRNFFKENKIDAFNPDVIHIHSPGPLGLWARKWAKKNNVRVVTTVHATPTFSASYLPFSFLYEDFIKESGWKFWEWFLETSDVVIAPSYFIVEKLKKIGIKNTIFRAPFWIEPYQLTKKTQKKKTTDFLFFGRLDPDKNLPFLLESWSKVSVPNAHLTIAGRDLKDQRKDLQTLAKTLGCESTVTVFGKVSEKKKLELFSKTDFFVMPSKVEVQSIVTYQAALSGIPVVVARASALPEIVAHSTAPDLIFDPDDPTSLTRVLEKCCTKKASYTKNYTLSKDFRKSFTKETILNNLVKKIYSI